MTLLDKLMNQRIARVLAQILSFATFLLIWEVAARALNIPAYLLPPPSVIAVVIYRDIATGVIIPHFTVTLNEVILGFGSASIAGVVLGSAIGLFPRAGAAVYPLILALQTIPKIALAPLFLIWFGFGPTSKVVTVATVVVFPVLVNVIAGLRTVDERQLLMMRSLNSSRFQVYRKLQFPSMLPFLFAGLEVAVVLSVTGAVVSEFIGAPVGLGALILQRQSMSDVAGVFSSLFYLTIMGLVLHWILSAIGRRYTSWAMTEKMSAR